MLRDMERQQNLFLRKTNTIHASFINNNGYRVLGCVGVPINAKNLAQSYEETNEDITCEHCRTHLKIEHIKLTYTEDKTDNEIIIEPTHRLMTPDDMYARMRESIRHFEEVGGSKNPIAVSHEMNRADELAIKLIGHKPTLPTMLTVLDRFGLGSPAKQYSYKPLEKRLPHDISMIMLIHNAFHKQGQFYWKPCFEIYNDIKNNKTTNEGALTLVKEIEASGKPKHIILKHNKELKDFYFNGCHKKDGSIKVVVNNTTQEVQEKTPTAAPKPNDVVIRRKIAAPERQKIMSNKGIAVGDICRWCGGSFTLKISDFGFFVGCNNYYKGCPQKGGDVEIHDVPVKLADVFIENFKQTHNGRLPKFILRYMYK